MSMEESAVSDKVEDKLEEDDSKFQLEAKQSNLHVQFDDDDED